MAGTVSDMPIGYCRASSQARNNRHGVMDTEGTDASRQRNYGCVSSLFSEIQQSRVPVPSSTQALPHYPSEDLGFI